MPTHLVHSDAARPGWPNILWPTLRRPRVGAAGEVGRLLHWTGAIAAGLCVLLAAEFLVEGWARHLSGDLLVAAVGLVFGARGLRWLLARE